MLAREDAKTWEEMEVSLTVCERAIGSLPHCVQCRRHRGCV